MLEPVLQWCMLPIICFFFRQHGSAFFFFFVKISSQIHTTCVVKFYIDHSYCPIMMPTYILKGYL